MSRLGRQTNTKHHRCSWILEGKGMAAVELKVMISLWYLAWRIWDIQDYAGMDCSPLIIIPVKYCWTYKQPGHPRECHPHRTTEHVLLLLKALYETCSLKADNTLGPSCHTPQTGATPWPSRLHQKINVQWPARRWRKKTCHTSKQLQLNCPKHIIFSSADIQIQPSCPCFQFYFRHSCFFTGKILGNMDIHQRCKGAQPKASDHVEDKGELWSRSSKHFTQL